MPLFDRFRRRLSVRTRRDSLNETQPPQDIVMKNQLASPVSVLDDGSFALASAFHKQKHPADTTLVITEQEEYPQVNTHSDNNDVRFVQDTKVATNTIANEFTWPQESSDASLSEPPQIVESQCSVASLEEYSKAETRKSEATTVASEWSEDSGVATLANENEIPGVEFQKDEDTLDSLDETSSLVPKTPILQDLTNHAATSDLNATPSTNVVTKASCSPDRDVGALSTEQQPRKRVFIEKGNNKNKKGAIIGLSDRRTYKVELDSGLVVNVRKTSVRYLEDSQHNQNDNARVHDTPIDNNASASDQSTASNNGVVDPSSKGEEKSSGFLVTTSKMQEVDGVDQTALNRDVQTVNQPTNPDIGKKVVITIKANNGKRATIVRLKNKGTYEVKLDQSGKLVGVRVTSVKFVDDDNVATAATDNRAGLERDREILESSSPPATTVGSAHQDQNVIPRGAIHDHVRPSNTAETNPMKASLIQSRNKPTANETSKKLNVPCKHNGQMIKVKSKGPNQGKIGKIIGRYNKGTYNVLVDGETIGVRDKNVIFLGNSLDTQSQAASSDGQSQRSSATRRSRRIASTFRLPSASGDGLKLGKYRITKIRAVDPEDEGAKEEITFLSHLFNERILVQEIQMRGPKQRKFDSSFEHSGRTYELVSAKIEEDKQSSFAFGKPKVAKLMYVDTSCSPDGSKLSVKDALAKFGDFSVLRPRKVMARLELFQSPARFPIYEVDDSHFCEIPEQGHVGCGFISEDFLKKICEKGNMTKSATELASAIQVRLFIPNKGVHKGMLQRKRISSGPDVQLPPSMQKVLASAEADELGRAAILVCKNGVHPSPGSANEYIGRRLDPKRKPPPEKSFKTAIKKPLSDMVLKLWRSLGVPEKEIIKYKRDSVKTDRRNHAWVVGVADPTGALPPDHVYVPGMGDAQPHKIFVTRSPCLNHDDGRMLDTVVSKPESISEEHWDELQSLPFGSIVFSSPREGMMPIPERIACGDLDGDLYLVCWDTVILSLMSDVEPLLDQPCEDDGVLKTSPPCDSWLDDAHELMVDAGLFNVMGRLTGTLYKLSEKEADKSPLFKRDPNAIAFAKAYNKALEFKKHGGRIYLPEHLHEKLPKGLREYVTAENLIP